MKCTFKRICCLFLALVMTALLCTGCFVYTNEETQYYVYFYDHYGNLADIKQKKSFLVQAIELFTEEKEQDYDSMNPIHNHQNFDITIPTVILHKFDVAEVGTRQNIYEHHFMGWSLTQGSDHVDYLPGDSYSGTGEVNMYAVFSNDPEAHADQLKIDTDDLTITCKECGCRNPQVSLNTFSTLYHWAGLDYDSPLNWQKTKIATKYLVYQGCDEVVLEYLMQFNMDSEDFEKLARIQETVTDTSSAMNTAASTVQKAVEIQAERSELEHGWASQSYITDEWEQTAGAIKFLNDTVALAQAIEQFHTLLEGAEMPEDELQQFIETVQTYTAMLPDATYYGVALNTLSTTLKAFFACYEKREYMYEYYDQAIRSNHPGDGILSSEKWSVLSNVYMWQDGPSLEDVAEYYPKLSDKGKALMDEYIEFRVTHEFNTALANSGFTFESYIEYLTNPY